MKDLLHILHLEDDTNDASLIHATLETEGIPCVIARVETRDDFQAALERGGIDLILSDYSLPAFDGSSAIALVRATCVDIPVILVSGTLGEEQAIESLKNGATDYVLKERLSRLAPSVRRAMQEVEDREERWMLEAQFIEAQKMEVIGHLASGVAHDFNNILAVIMFSGELMDADLPPDSPLKQYTQEIRDATERAAGLTRQLLVFSRKQTVVPVVLDLNDTVKELHKMLRRLVDDNITLTFTPGFDIGRVKADSGYLGQVLMNLVVNARDAMPNGGALNITTSNVTLDEHHGSTQARVIPGDYAMISVSDTGGGMTEEIKAQLFKAFFTTKPSGKGTGLGLVTCRTIVEQSGGHINFSSAIGEGTTFNICLPCVDQPLPVPANSANTGPLPRGTETLLVVEDEPSVRHLARGVLEGLGYEVLSASNGQEALRVARDHQGPPLRLVISDVIMPLMGGMIMAEWLKTAYPDLKVLFTSGYTDDAITQSDSIDPGIAFLPKPYTPGILACRVREMLDGEAAPHHEAETAFQTAGLAAN